MRVQQLHNMMFVSFNLCFLMNYWIISALQVSQTFPNITLRLWFQVKRLFQNQPLVKIETVSVFKPQLCS